VTDEEGRELQNKGSQMAKYFLYAAIIHGGIAAFVTFLGAFGDIIGVLPLAVARVIAGGGPGMWFTVGYVMYTIVGVVATAVTSLFYYYIENVEGKVYKGAAKALSWIHLILGNIGVAGASLCAMWGGYYGAVAMLPKGATTLDAHHVLVLVEQPIAAFIGLALIGFFAGGLGYLSMMRSKS